MYFQDDFVKSFCSEGEMMQFLVQLEKNASWQKQEADSITVLPMTEEECAGIETEETEGILEDTGNNTGLLVSLGTRKYPLGSTAVRTLENRAKISGRALSLLSKERLARILNECLEVSGASALVRIGEGKVRAAHSQQYKVLPMPEIFQAAMDAIHGSYQEVRFSGGYVDHTRATARWEIADEALLETYRKVITDYEGSCPQLLAQIRVTTSDTADSGANIFYNLLVGPMKRKLAMGMAVKMEHEGDSSVEKFSRNMETAFSRYRESARHLEVLMHVHIRFPLSVMDGMLKKIRIPADLREETMNLFMNTNGTESCSAYEVYCGICECLYLAQNRGMNGYAMAVLEEEVSRCLTMRYSGLDFPGELEQKGAANLKCAA